MQNRKVARGIYILNTFIVLLFMLCIFGLQETKIRAAVHKNAEVVKTLKQIIMEQRKKGVEINANLNDELEH